MTARVAFPTTVEAAVALEGERRAGGTDLMERRRSGVSGGDVVDLRDVAGLETLAVDAAGLQIGAKVRIAALGGDPAVKAGWPALAAAANGLATPQIRAVATVGGNVMQRVRCWYFRHPDLHCLKKGGSTCLAREGDHLWHSVFDLGPCIAPHASTLACALLAYGASVKVAGKEALSMAAFLGDGTDPRRENRLGPGDVVVGFTLPAAVAGERGAYFRSTTRERAEWPLVEAAVALVVNGGTISQARVAIGGVAPIPLRLTKVEEALNGQPAEPAVLEKAAALAAEGTKPPPMAAYKVDLIPATVLETLERALQGA